MNKKVLIVDDDIKLGNLMVEYLGQFAYEIQYVSDSQKAIESIHGFSPDFIILDVMMPSLDGFELCKQIRKFSNLPILFLSARSETIDKIIGLEIGADDYLPKPFEPRELLARIESILRRVKNHNIKHSIDSRLKIDSKSMLVVLDEEELDLTGNEFLALNYLWQHSNKIVSRDELISFIQGHDSEVYGRAIDILVSRVRQKLGDDPKEPKFIKTIRGLGYRFIGAENEE
ncbi:MAG: response regulator transcription factor [Bdellovibrionales bacterium]